VTNLLDTALAWHTAGTSVLPAAGDGSKMPAVPWKAYQTQPATADQLHTWLQSGTTGIGIVCGAVSGNLEMLELEGRAITEKALDHLADVIQAAGLGDLWAQISLNGYVEETPSGGLHFIYRVTGEDVPGNLKLARRPATEAELADNPTDKVKVLAETRGEGGWVVIAPSAGATHPTGKPWSVICGSPAAVPTITAEQRHLLHQAIRTLDQMPAPEPAGERPRLTVVRADGDVTPGDDFEARTDWADQLLLGGAGWRVLTSRGDGYRTWKRPGKDTPGISATTGKANDRDRLYVFSSATEFEQEKPYNKFGAYALLHHGGDHSAAAKELRRRGYGTQDELSPSQRDLIADLIPGPRIDGSSALAPQPAENMEAPEVAEPTAEERAAEEAAIRRQQKLQLEIVELRIRREARRQVDAEEHAATWREPESRRTLVDELAIPDEPVRYLVDDLVPSGANVLLTAQFKAGKTTLSSNLVRSLVDGDSFLGKFDVNKPDGRVAIFNYEVDERQYRRWLRDIGIINQDLVSVLNLRGYRLPVIHPHIEDWIVRWLADHEVSVWIVDPFARAFVGCGDEVSNSDVGVFLDTLDVIKERAGVQELILPTHTGRAEMAIGAERARGATRLDDWADVRWILTVDDQQRRFFRATGRDVEVEEEMVSFDPDTRHLRMGGWNRAGMRRKDLEDAVIAFVRENPGLGTNEIIDGIKKNRTGVSKALQSAVKFGQIYVTEGANNKRMHYAGTTADLVGGKP